MDTVESYLFWNGAVHDRFFATAEILAKLVSSAPRAVGLARLVSAIDRPASEVAKLCANLECVGLVRQDSGVQAKWSLTCDPCMVTLEDVFRCVLIEQQGCDRSSFKGAPDRASNDLDLLIMQAMIAINQSVFKHLRQFSLDRLKISSGGMFPATRRRFSDGDPDGSFEMPVSGSNAPERLIA